MPGPMPPGPQEHHHAGSQGPRLVYVYLPHSSLCFPWARPEGFEGETANQAGSEEEAEAEAESQVIAAWSEPSQISRRA